MKYSAKQYAQVLLEVASSASPADLDKVLNNFVSVLAENNDLRLFDKIAEEFHKKDLEKDGIKTVEVTSVQPLNRENERQIIEALNKYVKGKVELRKNLDESLVGGVLIQADDLLFDASVKKSLERLKKDLQE